MRLWTYVLIPVAVALLVMLGLVAAVNSQPPAPTYAPPEDRKTASRPRRRQQPQYQPPSSRSRQLLPCRPRRLRLRRLPPPLLRRSLRLLSSPP